jgi:O-antigen/teichoic acid export membrane protein
MQYPSIIAVITKGLSVAVGAVLLYFGAGLVWVGAVVALESALNLVAGMVAVRRFLPRPISFSWDWGTWRKLMREAYPFGLALILGQVYFTIDTVMLNAIKGDAVTGWYNAAYRLVVSLLFLPTVCATVVFPILSRYFGVQREAYRKGVQRSFELMLLIACPVGLGLSVFSDRVINVLYGAGFAESHLVLRIIGIAVVFLFVNYLAGMVLGSMNLQKLYFYGTGVAAVLSIALNLILIPWHAHIGAAIAGLATQASLFAIYAWILFRRGIAIFRWSLFGRVLGSTVVTLLFLRLLVEHHPVVLALVGMTIYIGALVLSRALTRDDWELVRQIVSRNEESA